MTNKDKILKILKHNAIYVDSAVSKIIYEHKFEDIVNEIDAIYNQSIVKANTEFEDYEIQIEERKVGMISGDYVNIKSTLPEHLKVFCDNIDKQFNYDLLWITYYPALKQLAFDLDNYTETGMNRLNTIIERTIKTAHFKNSFSYNENESECEEITVDILI